MLTLEATFNLYRRNLHCKHILFSGSGDNSYAGFLRPFIPVEGVSQHITLIEALPFAQYMQPISHKFQTANFPKIFRDTKIVAHRTSTYEPTRAPSVEQQTPPSAWATTAMKNALPIVADKENIPPPPPAPPATQTGPFVWVNKNGDRVDKPIDRDLYDKDIVYKIKGRKMCNKHWLQGYCDKGDFCPHDHKGPLTRRELENLRYVARMRPCDNGRYCRNPDCLDGHRCQAGNNCKKGNDCWFQGLHDVELVGVVKLMVTPGEDY